MSRRRLALVCVAALAFGHRSEAFCGSRTTADGNGVDLVTCLKAKAIATLDRVSRADSLPLTGSVTLVRDEERTRRQLPEAAARAVTERELRLEPDDVLDRMFYDKLVGVFSGRAVQIALPEVSPDQLRKTLEEGRGKMKKTMGMMMTAAAMKAMMLIPLALGVLFLMAGKAMIISKIALVLSLIITLKKLISKSAEHVVHESHSTSAAAWQPGGSSIAGVGGGGGGVSGGGWDRRSSVAAGAGHLLAYNSYKPL